jgi:hypothetical protein
MCTVASPNDDLGAWYSGTTRGGDSPVRGFARLSCRRMLSSSFIRQVNPFMVLVQFSGNLAHEHSWLRLNPPRSEKTGSLLQQRIAPTTLSPSPPEPDKSARNLARLDTPTSLQPQPLPTIFLHHVYAPRPFAQPATSEAQAWTTQDTI